MKKQTHFEKFMEEFNKPIYVSKTAEYKRSISKVTKGVVNASIDEVWNHILSSIFPEKEIPFLFLESKISSKSGPVYINELKNEPLEKKITYINKNKAADTFNTFGYELSGTQRGYTNIAITYTTKIGRTITGFNGKLGSIKFKWQASKQNDAILKYLKDKLEKK